jgi:CHAT domain-containing protein
MAPLDSWRGEDILHFAAHVRSHDAAPWQSEISLGGEPPKAVRAATIAEADLKASLVVLAGCESAGGSILSGEGVQGLTSAFIGAGTRAVVATLWPVEDRATFDLMRFFYRGLAAGRPVGDALANAREELRSDPRTSHPFFWAGFVLVGDPDVKVTLAEKGRGGRWLAVPTIIIIPFVILAIRRRLS